MQLLGAWMSARRDLVTAAVIQDLAGSSSDRQFALTVLPDLPLQHSLVLSYPLPFRKRRTAPASPRVLRRSPVRSDGTSTSLKGEP
jgi:hypothetical protein